MQFKGIMAIAGATTVLLAFEPTTLLAKVACGLLGGAAGGLCRGELRSQQLSEKLAGIGSGN